MKKEIKVTLLFIFGFIIFNYFSCSDEGNDNEVGTVAVLVVDNDLSKTPIPDIEITLTPINIVKFTDTSGTCNFSLKPDTYYVNAEVCCAGAGNIDYHVKVKVDKNKTANVELVGCLSCD